MDDLGLVLTRDRDAHAVVRGFVYQIDVTLERWLDLADEDELQLEAGEDIDQLAGGLGDVVRTLEQIKDLERNVTLRTAGAVHAIASFLEHRSNNPGARLVFRFTTTATYGLERPTSLSAPGIEIWEGLRTGSPAVADRDAALRGIREILKAAVKPTDLAAQTWTRFVEFVGDTSSPLSEIVERFEWAMSAPNSVDRMARVRQRLKERLGDDGSYEFLFHHVCRLLSRAGLKTLRRAEVEAVANARTREDTIVVNGHVKPLLEAIQDAVVTTIRAEVDPRLARVERDVLEISAELGGLRGVAVDPAGRLELTNVIPPQPTATARRAPLVDELVTQLEGGRWLALTGDAGTGKSSLLALLCARRPGAFPAIWLRLRDASVPEASALVQHVLRLLNGTRPPRAVGTVVLEDLPRTVPGDLLATTLATLVTQSTATRIVSTSAHPLPRDVGAIAAGLLTERPAPLMVQDDIAELLAMRGAEPTFVGMAGPIVMHRTGGHPTLVAVAVDLLERSAWNLKTLLDALTSDAYADSLASEIFERLLRTVEDDSACRGLLFRAALAVGSVTRDELRRLAEVEPRLEVRDDCIHRAIGTWIRDEGAGRLSVSPLLRIRVEDRLSAEVMNASYLQLASSLLAPGTVTPVEIARAASYYARAGEWSRVAFTLVHALMSIRPAPEQWIEFLFDISGMYMLRLSGSDAALVAAQRLRLRRKPHRTASDRQVVDAALADPSTPGFVLTYLAGNLALDPEQKDFALLSELTRGLMRVASGQVPMFPLESAAALEEAAVELDIPRTTAFIVWRHGALISNAGELREWGEICADLPPAVAAAFLADPHAVNLASNVLSRVWIETNGRVLAGGEPPAWSDVVAALDSVAAVAVRLDSQLLRAAVARSRATVLAEFLDRRVEAIEVATAVARTLTERWPRFLVLEATAAQLLYAGLIDEAKARYDEALPLADGIDDLDVIDALIRAARCEDDAQAHLRTAAADAIAERTYSNHAQLVARGRFEHAIALMRAERPREALAVALDAQEHAYDALRASDTRLVRATIALGGHTLACLHRIVNGAAAGGEVLEMPKQTRFLNIQLDLADRVDDAALLRGRNVIVLVASRLGDRVRAVKWGAPLWDELVAAGGEDAARVLPLIADPLVATALVRREYESALNRMHYALAAAEVRNPGYAAAEAVGTLGVTAAALAFMWDEAEGRPARGAFLADVRRVAETLRARASPPPTWASLEQLVACAEGRPGWKVLYDLSVPSELGPAKYMLASLEEDAPVALAVTLQVLAIFRLALAFQAYPAVLAEIVVPSIAAHWRARVAQTRFAFSGADHLLRVLDRLGHRDLAALRGVLSELVDAAGARQLPREAAEWLRGDDGKT